MIRAKTASIVNTDSYEAGREAVEELLDQLERPELVIAFVSATLDPARALAGINDGLPAGVEVVGCTSYAEINSEECLSGSVTVMGLRLEGLSFKPFCYRAERAEPHAAGAAFAREVKDFGGDLLIVFPDGLELNSTRLLLGMQSVLGQQFPIVGGIAGDDAKFEKTYQFAGREALSGAVVGVALKGPVELVSAARSGWHPIGKTRTATRVEDGNVLLELDGEPALEIYRQFLDHRWDEMPGVGVEFPIGVVGGVPGTQKMPDEQILLLRAIKGIDDRRQAIIFGGDIPQGAELRMARATRDDVIAGADAAGAEVCARMPAPSLALVFDCMARKVALGARYREEVKRTFAALGPDVPKIGFHTFGELSPVQGVTMHHDETFTIALIKG